MFKPGRILLESIHWLHSVPSAFGWSEVWGSRSIKGNGSSNQHAHKKSPSRKPPERASWWEVDRQMSAACCMLGKEEWPGHWGSGLGTRCRQGWDYWNTWVASMIYLGACKQGRKLAQALNVDTLATGGPFNVSESRDQLRCKTTKVPTWAQTCQWEKASFQTPHPWVIQVHP